ncbi:MAG TPA: ABC transporter permease [Acidimicrobiia bacterium]
MVSTLVTAMRAVLKRMRADWLIVGAAFTTVTLAAILLASGPIYADAVTVSALQRSLAEAPVGDANVNVEALVFPASYDEVDRLVRSIVTESLPGIGTTIHTHLEADAYELVGRSDDDVTLLASVQSFPGIEDAASLVTGTWPQAGTSLETTVHAAAAAELQLEVGDLVDVANRRDGVTATMRVVGLYLPGDDTDPFWFGDPLALTGKEESAAFRTFGPFVVTTETLFADFTPLRTRADWRVVPAFEDLEVSEVDALASGVAGLENDLNEAAATEFGADGEGVGQGFTVTTGLPALLADVDRSLTVTRTSVLALLAQLAILAGYALVLTAGLLADARTTETQLTRSRGAGPGQLAGMAFLEGFLIAAPAVVLGPYLATAILQMLNTAGPLATIDLTIDPVVNVEAFVLAAVAASLSIVALTWPAYRTARSFGSQSRRHRRQTTQTAASRAGVDFALLVLAGLVFWQLRALGPQLSTRVRGQFGVDPLLVIAPALALLAGAVLGLRFVPLLARLAERLAVSRGPVVGTLTAWQVARRPVRYARSALLLILAIGIGVFAAAYSTTWITSREDQAAYAVGADITAVPDMSAGAEVSELHLVETQRAVTGVSRVMAVAQRLGPLLAGSGALGQFVALDADEAGAVVTIREDLAPEFDEQMAGLTARRPTPETLDLPGEPSKLALTFEAIEQVPEDPESQQCGPNPDAVTCFDARVWVVLRDGDGHLHRIAAGVIPVNSGPEPLVLDLNRQLSDGSLARPVYPLGLLNIEIESQLAETASRSVRLTLARLEVEDASGATVPIAADFTTWVLASTRVIGAAVSPSIEPVSASAGGLVVDIETGVGSGTAPAYFSLRPHLADLPASFPVIVSTGFLEANSVAIGDSVRLPALRVDASATIAGTVSAFPTLDPSLGEAVLLDLATLQILAYQPGLSPPGVGAYWMSAEGDDSLVVAQLTSPPLNSSNVQSRTELASQLVSDPVALGAIGALTLGFVAAAVFAAVGFAVSATVSARERMVEFALLRALGLSGRQLGLWLAVEQGALVLVSLGLGTVIGIVLTATLLPLVSLTHTGDPAMPAVIVEYPWPAIVGLELAVVAVLAVIVVVMTVLLRRVGLGSLLRLGED